MADAKITALTAETAPVSTDILPMVDDPGGTPVTKKVTFSDARKALVAGSDKEVQFNDGATIGADADLTWDKTTNTLALGGTDTGVVLKAVSADPSAPAATLLRLYSKTIAGKILPAFVGPSGLESSLQPNLARNKFALFTPAGNSTTITAIGAAALTATGTATAANVATTNLHTWMKGLEYLVTTPSTTAVAGFRGPANQYGTGNAAGRGGFFLVCRWGPATGVATGTNRAFVGFTGSTSAPTDVQPSSLTNMFGMGWDAADTNIQFMYNDGSGTATKVDLGASFPRPTADRTEVYEIALFCASNTTTIYYQITNLTTGAVATGSVTTDIPSNTTLLSPRGWMSVGGTSSVIGIALKSLYIETDL